MTRALRHVAETAAATWLVAGVLIGLVLTAPPLGSAVDEAPWLVGPGLWIATTLGAWALLRLGAGRRPSPATLAAAVTIGGVADALVVAAGHPWPGLAVGIAVFSLVLVAGSDPDSACAAHRPTGSVGEEL